jgi:hypothetical protein
MTPPPTIIETQLEFVLLGPFEGNTAVIAQSKNLDVILIGKAVAQLKLAEIEMSRTPFLNDPEMKLYSLTTSAVVTDRRENFTLAWIGWEQSLSDREKESISDYFGSRASSIYSAWTFDNRAGRVGFEQKRLPLELAFLLFLLAQYTKIKAANVSTV